MKRLSALCLGGLLAVSLALPARAAASASLARAFVSGGTLYTYVEVDGVTQPITKAEAKIGDQIFPAAGSVETVRQAGFPVDYFLLVDNSTSMPAYREELAQFAQALADSAGEQTRFQLATLGDQTILRGEDLSAGDLAGALADLPFDETVTRLHSCLDGALDQLEAQPREGNELRCMIVLSDGVEYDPAGGVPYERLLERLSASDVLLYSVGFGTDEAALDSMGRLAESSGGRHQTVGEKLTAQAAGEAVAALDGGRLVTAFNIAGCRTVGEARVSVTLSSNGELLCRADREITLPQTDGADESDESESPQPAQPLPTPSQTAPSQGGQAAPQTGEATDPEGLPRWAVPAIGAAALALIAVAVFLLARSKTGKHPQAAPEGPAGGGPDQNQAAPGIYLRLEFPENAAAGGELRLTGELLAGRDEGCAILLPSPSVSRRHARVFLEEGRVYLQDLGSQNGTLLNGAPLTAPAPLRSGDTITTGDVTWRLKF